MSEMLDWAYQCLQEEEEIIVPLRKLWDRARSRARVPPFEQFSRAVLSDGRFEQVYSLEHDPILESFGCFAGPRVKLRSREITEQGILRLVQKHNERTIQVLLRALEILREDSNTNSEAVLGEAILILEQLRPIFKPWTHLKRGNQTT